MDYLGSHDLEDVHHLAEHALLSSAFCSRSRCCLHQLLLHSRDGKGQVLSWSQGGSGSNTDVGMGVAGVVLFGVPGLIGFAAKKHDYQYTINYVDEAGALDCSRVVKTYGCSWSAYVAANPAVQIWATKYPSMVPAEKARLRAID